jgi:hypothetical protein
MMEGTMTNGSTNVYWAVICKTRNPKVCETKHLISYMGTGGALTKISRPIDFRCPVCNQEHHYGTEDLFQSAGDGPPPSNFQEFF